MFSWFLNLFKRKPQIMPFPIKLCIDAGHGMANRTPGVYDPGCIGNGLEEADIVLVWAEELRRAVEARGIQTYLTRSDRQTPVPVGARAKLARAAGCSHLISIHVNDYDPAPSANGTETLYFFDSSREWAQECQTALLRGLNLKDRGVKKRSDLAVLKFPNSVLLELGFIEYKADVNAITAHPLIQHTCRMLAQTL